MKRTFKSYLLISAGWIFLLFSGCSSSPKERFEKDAIELNRSCPAMIDSYTQIDSVRYIADENRFQHYYTLLGKKDNPDMAQQEQKELLQRVTEFIKREPAMEAHRRYRVTMEYIYFSHNSGNELFRIRVTPDMYQ